MGDELANPCENLLGKVDCNIEWPSLWTLLLRVQREQIVSCVYDMVMLISNASVILLVAQWILSMYALQRDYWKGISPWHNAGIGCLANSNSFNALPLTMLPRLKLITAAFYTIGCEFEGDQKALSESWFVIYPSIVGIVFISSSLINFFAKVFRRRMDDWTITISIVLLIPNTQVMCN